MIEQDTVKLLRECDEGIKMGVSSIDSVLGYAQAAGLRTLLADGKREHETLGGQCRALLADYRDEGKDPPAMVEAMSGLTAKLKLAFHSSDAAIAGLMTDGCNMGMKSLGRYLNQYAAADEKSKDIAKRLIAAEEKMTDGLRAYL